MSIVDVLGRGEQGPRMPDEARANGRGDDCQSRSRRGSSSTGILDQYGGQYLSRHISRCVDLSVGLFDRDKHHRCAHRGPNRMGSRARTATATVGPNSSSSCSTDSHPKTTSLCAAACAPISKPHSRRITYQTRRRSHQARRDRSHQTPKYPGPPSWCPTNATHAGATPANTDGAASNPPIGIGTKPGVVSTDSPDVDA